VLEIGGMSNRERPQQVYDHRLRELIRRTGDISLATDLGVPRSTALGWLGGEPQRVVSLDILDMSAAELHDEVVRLRRRLRRLSAVVGLLVSVVRVADVQLDGAHIADPKRRAILIAAAERARKVLPASSVLRILRISASRYNAWVRAERGCEIEGQATCPRSATNQLTPDEVHVIREMATAKRYRHIPTGRLAVLAQRMGEVFASPSTWYRLVRDQRWERPRRRLHPQSPTLGVRATKPDEIWHIDTSILRLLDGTKVWLHAVIDNFSRKVLAWRVADRFDTSNAVAVLEEAVRGAVSRQDPPQLVADGGVENFNAGVDDLVGLGLLRRVRALVDIRFSNSMIESWWHNLKHQWLFLNRLETVAAVRRHVAFYVTEYNERIPHAAFRGQTPDEIYLGYGCEIPAQLEIAKREARRRRLAFNRAVSCGLCEASGVAA